MRKGLSRKRRSGGLASGKGRLVNASRCIGHGACAEACPVGTETRGVDIPYLTPNFETNLKGVFIVGELGGMGLIKNAVTQGTEAVEYIASVLKDGKREDTGVLDLIIVGSGQGVVRDELVSMRAALGPECPDIDIGEHCSDPYVCDFTSHCRAHIPENSVFDIARLWEDKKLELYHFF